MRCHVSPTLDTTNPKTYIPRELATSYMGAQLRSNSQATTVYRFITINNQIDINF